MQSSTQRLFFRAAFFLVFLNGLIAAAAAAPITLSAPTVIPVRIVKAVDANKARSGDPVTAKTLQIIFLPGGGSVPKGTTLLGHVVEAQPLQIDSTPYARQKPSLLSIHFDRIVNGDLILNVNLSVRAVADPIDSEQAARPQYLDEEDARGIMRLIGGGEFDPFTEAIRSSDGSIIGYNRQKGVFARLLPGVVSASDSTLSCSATESEESVSIFSPRACGVYGYANTVLADNGQNGSGTFTLASRQNSVKLYAGSTALLQAVDVKQSSVAQSHP